MLRNDQILTFVSKGFADNVYRLRTERKLSQATLASIADLNRSTIIHLERGRTREGVTSGGRLRQPLSVTVVKVAIALKVPVQDLIALPEDVTEA